MIFNCDVNKKCIQAFLEIREKVYFEYYFCLEEVENQNKMYFLDSIQSYSLLSKLFNYSLLSDKVKLLKNNLMKKKMMLDQETEKYILHLFQLYSEDPRQDSRRLIF